jgi:hypothetical protein
MSAQAFEIRCPACGSVVPAEAPGCLNCSRTSSGRHAPVAAVESGPSVKPVAPDVAGMSMKEYHRLVRQSYRVTEGPAAVSGSSKVVTYLPFVLLLIGIVVGAAAAFGHL